MSDTIDETTDPLGEALAEVAVRLPSEPEGLWVRIEDARRIAEDAATRAYSDVAANDE